MATSSFSSQGLPHGFRRKGPQTPGDLLIFSLEDLNSYNFNKFKNKLSDFTCGNKHSIPRGKLEDADWIKTKDLLIDKYEEEGALDVTIEVFRQIGLMGPATDLQIRRAQNAKLKKTIQDIRSEYKFSKEYKVSMIKMFQRITEYNSPNGKDVSLQKRYTKLLMRKGCQKKEEKERILRSTDGGYQQIMDKRSSDEYSPTTIQNLFDPDEDGFIPNIVVLQGAAGIGKTMTSKKIMLDWASGKLYIDKFDLVFYLSCREINTITGNINLVGLLSRCCKLQCTDDLVSILRDPESDKKVLFLIDGFDELRWTLKEESEACYDIFKETHKENLLQRLLKKQIFQQSSLILTTRSLAMKKLNTFIDDFRYVEVQGFTREDREEYVRKFFGKKDADKALRIIRDNDILYTMCAVPITCWIVCTVIQEIKKNSDLIGCDTITSIYLRYLELLIINHSRMDGRPQAIKTCLKNLCALANEGLLKQQILFEEEDLKRHGLSLSETKSVLLNKDIFCKDIRTQTFYSFIHLSVQEFLAALYYGLDDGFGIIKQHFLPNICKGRTLSMVYWNYTHLSVAVQFLFGLLNERVVEEFSNETDIKISIRASSAMKKWAIKDIEQMFPAHVILCLYETQNQNFIRSIMSSCPNLMLIGVCTNDLERDNNYSKQLAYCLSTLETEMFSSIYFEWLIVDSDCMKKLSPLLHRCKVVRFEQCKFQRRHSEYNESSSGFEMDHNGLSFLINPESKIQDLRLIRCGLTSSCYDVLHSILITNQSLTKLDLSYNDLLDSGINLLCKGLKHVNCTLQELSLGYCFLSHVSCVDLCAILTKSLTKLDLTANYLQDSGIKLLCEGLQNPDCILQELSLNGCGLTISCCDVLHNIIITNQSLTKLDLSYNDLLDSGIKLLCEGLQHPNCTLQELRLDRCGGTFLCCDDLISVINTNKALTAMDVTLDVDKMMLDSDVDHFCKVLQCAGFTVDGMNGHWIVYIQKKEKQTWWFATGLFKFWKYMYPDIGTISTM